MNDIQPKLENEILTDTMPISGIYKIVNKVNGKYYVGSSVNIKMRWRKHNEALRRGNHRNIYLQREWNKYGHNTFQFIIEKIIKPLELNEIEQYYLDIAKSEKDKTYNLSFIADRIEMTEEVKHKLSALAIARFKDKSNHPFYGKRHSISTIEKIKHTLKGKMSGKLNPKFDNRIFKFYNKKTNILFEGTRFDFYTKYNIDRNSLCALITKKAKSAYGWILN